METKLLNKDELDIGAELIQDGELVAFPTDTVYGLGGDATNEAAVQKIYEAKSRPSNRPINVLIAEVEDVKKYAKDISPDALKLAEAFWPGPLTIILKNANLLAPSITAGKETVGLRMPNNELALNFIKKCQVPLATPSANSSGRPSPTLSEHVMDDLNGKIAAVIDGNSPSYGIESTIIDFSDWEKPLILRPGNISKEAIEAVIQRKVFELPSHDTQASKEKHYEPKIPVYIVESDWKAAIAEAKAANEKIAILGSQTIVDKFQGEAIESFSLGEENDIESANRYLFEGLRTLETSQATIILAESYSKNRKSVPFMNRLESAANKKTI